MTAKMQAKMAARAAAAGDDDDEGLTADAAFDHASAAIKNVNALAGGDATAAVALAKQGYEVGTALSKGKKDDKKADPKKADAKKAAAPAKAAAKKK